MCTRSTKSRSKIILGTIERFEKLRGSNTVDHRISGVPLSAVEPQNITRKNRVKRLIEKFENHTHKESFIRDLSQMQKINKFSKESQDLIPDLNNTEIFELFWNSSKQQRPDCNTYWETGKIHCSSRRNMKSTRSPTEFDWNNRDVTSTPGYVSKKTAIMEWSTVLLKDKRCTTRRDRCLKSPDKKSTDAIQRYFHDGMPKKIKESHCQPSGGKKKI